MWCWSKLSSAKWEDSWEEILSGNPNTVINYLKGGKSLRVEVYADTEAELQTYLGRYGGRIREIKSQDWIAQQLPDPKDIKIRKEIIVSNAQDPDHAQALRDSWPDRLVLSIPPELAFGTGDHATTSTCLRLLVDHILERRKAKQEWTMLDIGCGTGILALAAAGLGGKDVEGFDFDPIAVEVAQRNAERNAIANVKLFTADVFEWEPEGRQWDIVVANLFSTILQKAFARIARVLKPQGTIIVSGILAEQWEETSLAAAIAGLEFDNVIRKGKWVTASGRHA